MFLACFSDVRKKIKLNERVRKSNNKYYHEKTLRRKENKTNQIPPLSIKLRRKVNVEDRSCEDMEVLRKIKNTTYLENRSNQFKYVVCQEIEPSSSIDRKQHTRTYDVCLCEESNTNCMEKATNVTHEMLEKSIERFEHEIALAKREKKFQKHWNQSCKNYVNTYLIAFLILHCFFNNIFYPLNVSYTHCIELI